MAVKNNRESFRAAHDRSVLVPQKIKAALASLAKDNANPNAKDGPKDGSDGWEYEAQFIKRAGISQTDMGVYRDQFKGHVVQVSGKNPKRVWVASEKEAAKFRKDVGDAGI